MRPNLLSENLACGGRSGRIPRWASTSIDHGCADGWNKCSVNRRSSCPYIRPDYHFQNIPPLITAKKKKKKELLKSQEIHLKTLRLDAVWNCQIPNLRPQIVSYCSVDEYTSFCFVIPALYSAVAHRISVPIGFQTVQSKKKKVTRKDF